MKRRLSVLLTTVVAASAIAAVAAWGGSQASVRREGVSLTAQSSVARKVVARRMKPRPDAKPVGTVVTGKVGDQRAFVSSKVGFALASDGSASYGARTTDGGRVWRINSPQFHVDAADGPEGVGDVGIASTREYFAYGSSVVDVTTDSGHVWWEAFLGELVDAVSVGAKGQLLAYVQDTVKGQKWYDANTYQYVSTDGGREWKLSSSLGGA